jgi:hypothetical protein
MRLVAEIIELLSSQTPSLENALFKAQVLAHRLGERELGAWVESELRGYPDKASLPSYRVLPVTILANITNGVHSHAEQPLPTWKLDQRVRDRLETRHITESIVVVEQWSRSEADLGIVVPPEYYGHLKKGLDPSYEILRAWGKNSVGAVLQVVTEVRSRLLQLSLEIADKIPQEPEPDQMKRVSKDAAVGEVFRNAVFGDNTTIVVGSGSIQNVRQVVVRNDFDSLAKHLRASGLEENDILSLQAAIESDRPSPEVAAKTFGPSVRGWIGNMLSKAATGTWEVGIGAAGGVLAAAIAAYYGFGGA